MCSFFPAHEPSLPSKEPNGTANYDICDVCNGDGKSCLDCRNGACFSDVEELSPTALSIKNQTVWQSTTSATCATATTAAAVIATAVRHGIIAFLFPLIAFPYPKNQTAPQSTTSATFATATARAVSIARTCCSARRDPMPAACAAATILRAATVAALLAAHRVSVFFLFFWFFFL